MKLRLRKEVPESDGDIGQLIDDAFTAIDGAEGEVVELQTQISALESYLLQTKAPANEEDEDSKNKIAQCLHGLIVGYEKLADAVDEASDKLNYNIKRLGYVSQFIKFDEEGELRDGLRDELIENGEADFANLTLDFAENPDMTAQRQIQILEPVYSLTSRDHKEFFAMLAVEISKQYLAHAEFVKQELEVAE